MAERRRVLVFVGFAVFALAVAVIALHDLVLFRADPRATDYCRVSETSAAERGMSPGELTTSEADSGCRQGEVHLCGYSRWILADVIEVKSQPC